jgi:hypothetical protein
MKRILISALLILGLVAFTTPAFAQDVTANTGTAVIGGGQGQGQGQGQTINFSSPLIPATEQKDLTTVRNEGSGYRGFPIGPQMTYPGLPTYFNGPTDGASVTNLEDFLMYGNVWDIATLEAMAGTGSASDFLSIGYKVVTVAECPTAAQPEKVKALLKKQVKGVYKRVATITVKASNLNTTSEKLLAIAGLEAAKYGASEIHIIDAGKHRVMTGEGWGIGIYYYAAGLSASESSGQMGGGGTGYSTGESGYQDKPWIKVIAVIPAK